MQSEPAVNPTLKFSQQMRAVLAILSADHGLYDLTSPFVNFATESIDWEKILGLPLCQSQMAVCHFAYACWRDEFPEGTNPFDAVLTADAVYLKAITKGLSVRWGLSR